MKIEKGIPIPAKRTGGVGTKSSAYTELFEKMSVGDSFVAVGEKGSSVQSAVRQAAQKLGLRITTRCVEANEGAVKLRVWLLGKMEDAFAD